MICVVVLLANTLTLAINKQLYLIGIVVIAPHVNVLSRKPVPMGEEMEHRLLCPFTLIHIVYILGEASQIDDAEIRATGREAVGRRLTNIVETRPNELSTHIRRMLHDIPCLLMGARPRGMHIIIGRTHKRRIGIRQPPLLRSFIDAVAGHHVEASRLQGTDTLREDEGFVWKILGHILDPLVMIVEANDVDSTTLKQMVVRRRLVTTSSNGA